MPNKGCFVGKERQSSESGFVTDKREKEKEKSIGSHQLLIAF